MRRQRLEGYLRHKEVRSHRRVHAPPSARPAAPDRGLWSAPAPVLARIGSKGPLRTCTPAAFRGMRSGGRHVAGKSMSGPMAQSTSSAGLQRLGPEARARPGRDSLRPRCFCSEAAANQSGCYKEKNREPDCRTGLACGASTRPRVTRKGRNSMQIGKPLKDRKNLFTCEI